MNKHTIPFIALLSLTSTLPLVGVADETVYSPRYYVDFDNELVVLAKGYVEAFNKLPNGPRYVIFKLEGDVKPRSFIISEIKAHGGVVALSVNRGPTFVINPKNILVITNKASELLFE
jgi:hypothetical protein